MKLEELRKRLLSQQPQPPEIRELISGTWQTGEEETPAKPERLSSAGPARRTEEIVLTAAPGDSEQPPLTERPRLWVPDVFEERIQQLAALLGSIEALVQSTADGFELLNSFEAQMEQLVGTLEPVKLFCSKLEQLALGFGPLRIVHEQIVGTMAEFKALLLQLADLVEPAGALRLRATELAKALEPVDELAARFARLAGAFELAQQQGGAPMLEGGGTSL
jgi:hypothetical protein